MKDNKVYLSHILNCIENIFRYTEGMNQESFYKNFLVQDAVVRNFEIIGEAAKQITDDVKSCYPDIPWRKMAGMRDKLIHGYIHVDLEVIWETTTNVLPDLYNELKTITSNL